MTTPLTERKRTPASTWPEQGQGAFDDWLGRLVFGIFTL